MLNAIMRAFRQKLQERVAESEKALAANNRALKSKTDEVQQFVSVVKQQNQQIATLNAKVEKKKMKSTQTKQLQAETR